MPLLQRSVALVALAIPACASVAAGQRPPWAQGPDEQGALGDLASAGRDAEAQGPRRCGGAFLITGPGWKGTVPAGMTQVPLHTNGVGLEFRIETFSPAVREAMKTFGQNDAKATAAKYASEGMNDHLAKFGSRYGTAYDESYLMVFGGLGGNLMEDAMYFWLKTDESGQKLKGDTVHVVHFEKDKIPKTKAFWSLTLYNKDFYLPDGMPLGRHVRNSNSGMKFNADGSLDIYLQPDNPGPDKVDNWLPTPRGQEYF